jgi:uncharacterized 2Fe-2S/4Fe-4S cluster protein (DUF4445 family)
MVHNVVAQLLDLARGEVLAVRSALNPQARFGADIMSRVAHAMEPAGHAKLVSVLRTQVGKMVSQLLEASPVPASPLTDIVLVGNSVMHHLFCALDVSPFSHYPFESGTLAQKDFAAEELGWDTPGNPQVRFLPCIGGFVGSDILAGIFATGLHESSVPLVLVDLGTNGEIVVGDRNRIICASTAAGPAFEGARIYMGMRAATGAVSAVAWNRKLVCHVAGERSAARYLRATADRRRSHRTSDASAWRTLRRWGSVADALSAGQNLPDGYLEPQLAKGYRCRYRLLIRI